MSSPAFAVKTTGMRVVVVKTEDVAGYLQWLEKGKEVMKNLGLTATVRVSVQHSPAPMPETLSWRLNFRT